MKKFILALSASVLLLVLIIVSLNYYVYSRINYDKLNFLQQKLVSSVLQKFEDKLNSIPEEKRNIIDYNELLSSLNYFERKFADRIFSIDPKEIGFKGPRYSMGIAKDLTKIDNIIIKDSIQTDIQYYPTQPYQDYLSMMEDMKKELGKRLYIDSGYRSPGKQAYLFFYYLGTSSEFSLKENAKWIAMPGYSEHGNPERTAMDLVNEDAINGFSRGQNSEDFERLPEYQWLIMNASKYNFYLSYPKNNPYGVAFEPWHWHWENRGNLQ